MSIDDYSSSSSSSSSSSDDDDEQLRRERLLNAPPRKLSNVEDDDNNTHYIKKEEEEAEYIKNIRKKLSMSSIRDDNDDADLLNHIDDDDDDDDNNNTYYIKKEEEEAEYIKKIRKKLSMSSIDNDNDDEDADADILNHIINKDDDNPKIGTSISYGTNNNDQWILQQQQKRSRRSSIMRGGGRRGGRRGGAGRRGLPLGYNDSSISKRAEENLYFTEYSEATIFDLENGDNMMTQTIKVVGHQIPEGSAVYLRVYCVTGPFPLGIYVKELGTKCAHHITPNGRVFHAILSPDHTYSNENMMFLGNIYGLAANAKMGAAAKTLNGLQLNCKRKVNFQGVWGLTEQKMNAPDNSECVVQHIEGENKTIIGNQHPILNILNIEHDYKEYGNNSYEMNTDDYNLGYHDLMTIIKGLQPHYPSTLTISICPVYTDKFYDYDDPKQWSSTYGAYPYFQSRGIDISEYPKSYVAVSYEMIVSTIK